MKEHTPKCRHSYVFLRTEEKPTGHARTYLIQDVFFCQHCLIYRQIEIRTEEPDRDNPGKRKVVDRMM